MNNYIIVYDNDKQVIVSIYNVINSKEYKAIRNNLKYGEIARVCKEIPNTHKHLIQAYKA